MAEGPRVAQVQGRRDVRLERVVAGIEVPAVVLGDALSMRFFSFFRRAPGTSCRGSSLIRPIGRLRLGDGQELRHHRAPDGGPRVLQHERPILGRDLMQVHERVDDVGLELDQRGLLRERTTALVADPEDAKPVRTARKKVDRDVRLRPRQEADRPERRPARRGQDERQDQREGRKIARPPDRPIHRRGGAGGWSRCSGMPGPLESPSTLPGSRA